MTDYTAKDMRTKVAENQSRIEKEVREEYDRIYSDLTGGEKEPEVTFEGVAVSQLDDYGKLRWTTYMAQEYEKRLQAILIEYKTVQENYHRVRMYRVKMEDITQKELTKNLTDAAVGMGATMAEMNRQAQYRSGADDVINNTDDLEGANNET